MSIEDRDVARTPFAVIDVETTGLSPRDDRIVEIAVVVVAPGEEPREVLNTLVNPGRHVAGTEIHGINDDDVASAPTFEQVASTVVAALANRVVAAHNAYFDVRMLAQELDRCGYPSALPCVCTMLLPLVLDAAAPRLTLSHACAKLGVPFERGHAAASDAMAAAALLQRYVQAARKLGVRTFADLRSRARHDYEFLASFDLPPLPPPPVVQTGKGLRPRGVSDSTKKRSGVGLYLDAVLDAVADLHLSQAEVEHLVRLRDESRIGPEEIRAVHAKVFWGMLARFVEDVRIDVVEVARLHRLAALLSQLGWAPGEPLERRPSI